MGPVYPPGNYEAANTEANLLAALARVFCLRSLRRAVCLWRVTFGLLVLGY